MFQYINFFKLLKKHITFSRVSILAIFLFSITISLMVWSYSKNYYEKIASERFEADVIENLEHIATRMALYENVLRSGIGLFHASDEVTRADWYYFVKALNMQQQYPGIQGIGFSMMLQPDEIDSIEQKMRQEGFKQFFIKPAGNREEYSAILYLEPMDKRNQEAIGYDMFSEPTRRAAMQTARDTGLPAITAKVTLVQEIDADIQAGMLMYLPLYKKGAKLDTVKERQRALIGFVYSPFRMNDLMNNIVLDRSILHLKIYDCEKRSDKHLLYSSFKSSSYISKYQTVKTLTIHNHTWYIYFASSPQFDTTANSKYPLLITLVGLIINLFLLFVIITLVKSLQRLQIQSKKNQEQTSYMLHQSRLAQMGEMISMIAHQWRQPLASISAITGTLSIDIMMNKYDPKFFEERLESINTLSQYLSSTIDDFRSFFKEKKTKERSTIKQIIDDTLQIIGPVLESKEIKVIFDYEDEIMISTFVNEVKQVILNILKNAEDALLDNNKVDPAIWISWYNKDSCTYITIEDNAGGIPKEIITTIFDPYFSTKQEKDGTGLGLYMSKTIIEEHCDGELSVLNTDKGAKFIIVLPK